jgi:autotransporter-associated beta strand protein
MRLDFSSPYAHARQHKPPHFMQTRRIASLRKPVQTSALAILAITLLAFCQSSQGALVAYWDFDEGTGTTVTDRSGSPNNHNGTFGTGTETPSWIPGRLGTAVNFDWTTPNQAGAGDRVIVPFHPELHLNGPFTISYWYRMDQPFPTSQFPGIMRIGSQSQTNGSNIGWGFFRQNNMVFKRNNVQPARYPNMNFGEWYHLALRYDGVLNSSNTLYFINGQQLAPFVATNGWTNATATTVFEMGRMDAFDDAALDDLALWGSEAVSPAKIRSLYTVPTALGIEYNVGDLRAVWAVFDGGPGSSAVVKGSTWSYTSTLPGSTTQGDAYISGGSMYLVLGPGTGVSAPITIITGTFSPNGIGRVSTLPLVGMPAILVSNANVVFDLNNPTNLTGASDLIDVMGDLTFVNSTISIDPLSIIGGTYRLFNYTGTKTGSPTILNTTRYTLTPDETTPGQINLDVSGSAGAVRWNSTSSGVWDLMTLNWANPSTGTPDRFFQGDWAIFDDTGPFQTNITLAGAVFPERILVDSSTRNYSITGAGQIGGVGQSLAKIGSSTLTLATPNTFNGNVYLNGGTIRLGNASALGTTERGTFVSAGATLDLGGNSPGTEEVTVAGAGVNNAGAVVNTGGALGNNGLRGRVTLTGDTTFGGVNRWDVIGGTLVGNGYRLTKVGTPEIALTDLGETDLGPIDIMQGILTILGTTRAGDPTQPITVNTNAILALWDTRVILNKPVVMNQAIMRNSTSGGVNISTNVGAVTLNGDATFQATANIALLGVVGGPGNLIKVNTGTLYLGGGNTYAGRTAINAGRLALLDGASLASPRIEVASGTVFDVTRMTGGYSVANGQTLTGNGSVHGSLTVPGGGAGPIILGAGSGGIVAPGADNVAGTLTVTNEVTLSGGTLNYDITSATTEGGNVNDLINVGGNLNLTGTTTVNLNPLGLLTVGNTYTLINYTGALSGTEANLSIVTSSRYTFSVSLATPGKVTVTVTGGAAADLFWLGGALGAENLWDLQTTENWSDSLGNPERFFGGDNVLFDDFAVTNVVDLVGALTPAAIVVENGSVDYVFQGSGKLSGNSTLTKKFANKLTIANSGVNDFVGAVNVNEGTLEVGNGATAGNLGSGSITISNGAAMIINRSDTVTLANTMSGEGSLSKPNNNLIQISGNNSNYLGAIAINDGTLRPGHTNALGPAGAGTTIASGATLDVNALNLGAESITVAGAGVANNGAIINSAGGQNNALRFVTLTGDTTLGGTGRWDVRANPSGSLLTGGNPFNLTKIGNNQVSLVDLTVDPALGDINVNSGTFSVEFGTMAGDPARTMTVANNATLQFWARSQPWNKVMVLNGGRNILVGNGSAVMSGPVTLNAIVTLETAAATPATALTVSGPIGGTGALTKTGSGSLTLLADNTYPGATTISAGPLTLGNGTNAGWVAGNIVMGANALTVHRSDQVTVSNALTSTGPLNVRTPEGLVFGNHTVNFSVINIGLNSPGRLVLPVGFTGNIGALSAGDSPGNSYGDVHQFGGTLNVSGLCRIGHWPNETSTYLMGGGALNVTATPGGVVNLGGQPEQPGVIYLGVDGTGVLIQTGGVVRAHGIVFDGRGNTAGTDTFTLTGGETIIGPSGFKSGALDVNASYAINLGGGRITSSANWSSVLRMDLSGANGNVTFNTAGFSNVLSGALTGIGGLIKTGSGTLALTGNATYEGTTTIEIGGTLLVRGSLGIGSGSVTAGVEDGPPPPAGATLAGDGTINDPVRIYVGGRIAPGHAVFFPVASIGKLTINNTLTLDGGSADLDISKSGSVLTNDLIAASGAVSYGGTLHIRANGDALANGDVFNLFDGASFTGSFEFLNLPTLPAGLYWDTSKLAVDGTLRVTGPRLTFARSGNSISLSWPSDTTLQAQTNAPGIGLNNDWVTVDPGTNSITITVDPSVGSVFYRLFRP